MKTTQLLNSFKKSYETENFLEAKNLLLSNKELFESNVFFFNLGIVEFRLENYAYSKLLLNRAQVNGLESEQSKEILKTINTNLSITRAQDPVTIKDHLISTTHFVGVDIIIIISSLLILVTLIKLKEIYGLTLKLLAIVFVSLPLVWSLNFKLRFEDFVSLTNKEVREGPSNIFTDSFNLPEGIKYTISKRYKDWVFITYPNKYSGWIKFSYEEKI